MREVEGEREKRGKYGRERSKAGMWREREPER